MALFAHLQELFAQDPLIDEIGLVLGVDEAELTPANAFVLEDHKLGVALSAGPQLFRQARSRFHELNPQLSRAGDASDEALVADLLDCTRAVLLVSADFYTAWNTRKALVVRGYLDAVAETRFCDLVFTLHPKSIDTWAYRRWLATQLLPTSASSSVVAPLAGDALRTFYRRQVEVCSLLAEQKPRNYHAWSFRHWIVSKLPVDALEAELQEMRRWCATHITDHSGWNHRQHVVNEVIRAWRDESSEAAAAAAADAAVRELIVAEHAFVSEIMAAYPTHEALWCHRRFVIQLMLKQFTSARAAADAVDDEAAGSLVPVLGDLEARVAMEAAGAPEDAPPTTEQLSSAWRSVEESLRRLPARSSAGTGQAHVLLAAVREVETAWRVANRFSRRFALWSLERVRLHVRERDAAASLSPSLLSMASTLRLRLSSDDALLRDLWAATSS